MLTVPHAGGEPLDAALSTSDVSDNVSIDGIPADDPDSVRRVDDNSLRDRLQPNVTPDIQYRWVVGEDDLHDGDTLQVTLNDLTQHVGGFVMSGTWWKDRGPPPSCLMIDDTTAGKRIVKPWAQWLIGTGLVVVAWGVAAVTPPKGSRPRSRCAVVGRRRPGATSRRRSRASSALIASRPTSGAPTGTGWSCTSPPKPSHEGSPRV